VAVRLRDLDDRSDLDLTRDGSAYRSALIVGTRDGRPLGDVVLGLDGSQRIDGARLHEILSGLAPRAGTEPADDRAELDERRTAGWEATPPAGGSTDVEQTISVVINTCANPGPVIRAVASALACDPAPMEVIVVENRPDGSPVAQALRERFGGVPVVYVEEPRPGLSIARNAGLAAARGEIVAFTDDDVVLDVNWVARLVAAFDSEPRAGCVTGLILPADLETDAQLRVEEFAGFGKGYDRRVYRLSEPTSPLFPFAAGEFGSGASAALRADVARSLGGFDPALGTGTIARGGEDLDMFIRVLLSGHALVYEPAAILWHEHPAGNRGVRHRAYGYGISLSALLTKYLVGGHAPAMLTRAPAAWRFIEDPDSRKNAGKPADFPASLEWIERLGMLVGPLAYLQSRRRTRGLGADRVAAVPPYLPAWVGEVDLERPLEDLVVPRLADGRRYERARLLVRDAGAPIGFVDVTVARSIITRARLAGALQRAGMLDARSWEAGSLDGGSPTRPVRTPAIDVTPPEPEPAISVVICTRDRPASLPATLQSVLALDYGDYEVVVVDNAPTGDGTRAVVQELDDRRLRYVVEPVPGLSRARNRGIAEAAGEVVAFTDDDVIVDRRWLRAIARGFSRSANVACVTGLATACALDTASQAYFEARVKWSDHLSPRLFDLQDHPGRARLFPYAVGEIGAGVNFAVRRAALPSIGKFDEALGTGTPAMGGEDLDFFLRVILQGWSIAYEPEAIVWHKHRSEPSALRRQMVGYGSGLSAYAFKHLLHARTWSMIVTALRHPRASAATATARPVASPTPGLRSAELRGLLTGPASFLTGRRRARKSAQLPDGPVHPDPALPVAEH
jgi:GT2 family glycosyltransferase